MQIKLDILAATNVQNLSLMKTQAPFSNGIGMSYDVIIEPRHDFSAPVIRYQWRAGGCPLQYAFDQNEPSKTTVGPPCVQSRVFISREPADGSYCSENSCRENRGTYRSTLPEGRALGAWNQFNWDKAFIEPSVPGGVPI
jgi:hypothetical protein